MTIHILLAEDHQIVREGTRQLLQQDPELVIVAEASNGIEAVQLAQSLSPEMIVMDVRMPGMNGLDATREVKLINPAIKVLILSAYDDDRYLFPILEVGASGYLLKTASGAELIDAIHAVMNGGMVFSPQVTGKVLQMAVNPSQASTPHALEGLTRREMEVLHQAAQGRSNKAIAGNLSISPQTVQVHLRHIFGKLRVSSRSEAAALALSRGWITLEGEHDDTEA